ncbi:MAG: type 4a pilus biogenesis protein PilO [Hylemonella sp.]|nr:type 4a pilus biogenesis protein PilO [Hylemonella sp.]
MATQTETIQAPNFQERLLGQFQNLDPQDPSVWPAAPRYLMLTALAVVTVVALWFLWLEGFNEELEAERAKEVQLRQEYKTKLVKAVNLDLLKKQLEQVKQYVHQLEKQLPSKAEMDALLSDINQAGLGRSLMFDLFRPGQVAVKNYYAELPISIKVSGRYHDIGAFASDIAHLSRIVTLNNMHIKPGGRDGGLVMEATAKTFRYLDQDEVASQSKAKPRKAGAKR